MSKPTLSIAQVAAITRIEQLISILYDDPEQYFAKIIKSIDEHNISENQEMMNYLRDLLASKGYIEYSERFSGRYHMESRN